MKNRNIEVYDILYLIFSFCLILLAFAPFSISVSIADNYEVKQNVADNILTVLLFLNMLLPIVLMILCVVDLCTKNYIRNILKTLGFVLVILSYLLSMYCVNQYVSLTNDYIIQSYAESGKSDVDLESTITLDELEQIIDDNGSAIIYFERSDCPECIALTPDLVVYLNNYGVLYYQYNTLDDREDNSDRLNEVLLQYSVDSVPTLVELSKGEVVQIYSEEDISLLLYPE